MQGTELYSFITVTMYRLCDQDWEQGICGVGTNDRGKLFHCFYYSHR